MLVTNLFSFSQSVFCSIKIEKNHHFSNVQFVVWRCFQFRHVQNLSFGKGIICSFKTIFVHDVRYTFLYFVVSVVRHSSISSFVLAHCFSDRVVGIEQLKFLKTFYASLTLSQTTNFRPFQTESVCRRQFQTL